MNDHGYGLRALVVFNSVLFIAFAVSFFHPKSKRDWREERDVRAEFGAAYAAYAASTPRLLPRWRDPAGGGTKAPKAGGIPR